MPHPVCSRPWQRFTWGDRVLGHGGKSPALTGSFPAQTHTFHHSLGATAVRTLAPGSPRFSSPACWTRTACRVITRRRALSRITRITITRRRSRRVATRGQTLNCRTSVWLSCRTRPCRRSRPTSDTCLPSSGRVMRLILLRTSRTAAPASGRSYRSRNLRRSGCSPSASLCFSHCGGAPGGDPDRFHHGQGACLIKFGIRERHDPIAGVTAEARAQPCQSAHCGALRHRLSA